MKQPWMKREDETSKAYHAFCLYRDMGLQRTLDKVRQELDRPSGYISYIKKWSSKHDWVSRAEAYDEHLEYIRMAEKADQRRKRNEQILQTCRGFHDAAHKKLKERLDNNDLDDLTPTDLIRWFREAIELELKVSGEPTENIKVESVRREQTEEEIDEDKIGEVVRILNECGVLEKTESITDSEDD